MNNAIDLIEVILLINIHTRPIGIVAKILTIAIFL